ncbi:MAG: hypothetical protein ACLPKB_30380 [Xanthobacteraceae bacterium]
MAYAELRIATNPARKYVVIELWMDGKRLGHINLDGATAEEHIHAVAKHRAELVDPVSPDLHPGARLEAILDPKWRVLNPIEAGRILALRHPGLGWLPFVFPDKEARSISDWLTKDLPAA